MIYWTPLELEQVFDGWDKLSKPEFVEYDGNLLEVQPLGNGLGKITRLISGNPNDYLQDKFTPGTLVGIN